MSASSASTGLLALGFIAGEIAVAAAGAAPGAPEWIKVTPRGDASTRDGRHYSFIPETLAARFTADAVDVAVDTNHALALRATRGEAVDPVGYAAELQARPDGTYARVNWLDPVAAAATVRKHRYVSPTFHHDEAGQATWLHSISLVAAPALSMPALLHALGGTPEPSMKQIAKALGLPEDATEAACLSALQGRSEVKPFAAALGLSETSTSAACLSAIGAVRDGLKPVAKKLGLPETADGAACLAAIGALQTGGGELVATLQANLSATTERLAAVEKAARDKTVTELLDGALTAKKIVPAQREHLASLCATDDGLANVRAMLAATVPGLQASGLDSRGAPTSDPAQDPATLSAAAHKIQDERRAAGQPIGWAEAVALAAEKSKA